MKIKISSFCFEYDFQKKNSKRKLDSRAECECHVTGFDFKPSITIMYFWSKSRQDGEVSEFVGNIRMFLPTSWPSNASYTFAR